MQNNSGEAVDQIIRITTEAGEVGLRLSGAAAKEFTLLIASLLRRDQGKKPKHSLGRQRLMKFLRSCHGSGTAIERFTVETPEKFKAFEREADKIKLNFTAVMDKQDKSVTALFREDDTRHVNDILHSLGYDKFEPGKSDLHIDPVEPADLANDAPEHTPDAPAPDAKKTEHTRPSQRRPSVAGRSGSRQQPRGLRGLMIFSALRLSTFSIMKSPAFRPGPSDCPCPRRSTISRPMTWLPT